MTKSEMFKKAHEIARNTKTIAGSYKIAFACALKDLYAGARTLTASEKAEMMGASKWEKYGYSRIYLNQIEDEIISKMGFKYATSGKLASTTDDSIWFFGKYAHQFFATAYIDCDTNEIHCKCNDNKLVDAVKAIFAA